MTDLVTEIQLKRREFLRKGSHPGSLILLTNERTIKTILIVIGQNPKDSKTTRSFYGMDVIIIKDKNDKVFFDIYEQINKD